MQTKEDMLRTLPYVQDAEKHAAITPYAFYGGRILKLDSGGGYSEIGAKDLVNALQEANVDRSKAFFPKEGNKELLNNIRETLKAFTDFHIAPVIGTDKDKTEFQPWQDYDPLNALSGFIYDKMPDEFRKK